jgi:hypothetical protein
MPPLVRDLVAIMKPSTDRGELDPRTSADATCYGPLAARHLRCQSIDCSASLVYYS